MKYAIVEAGVVTNVIVAHEAMGDNWVATEQAGPGWLYENGEFLTPPPVVPTDTEVREKRDALLSESDWTQVADAPVNKAAWAAYRQELRDIPSQAGFPGNVVWPSQPE